MPATGAGPAAGLANDARSSARPHEAGIAGVAVRGFSGGEFGDDCIGCMDLVCHFAPQISPVTSRVEVGLPR